VHPTYLEWCLSFVVYSPSSLDWDGEVAVGLGYYTVRKFWYGGIESVSDGVIQKVDNSTNKENFEGWGEVGPDVAPYFDVNIISVDVGINVDTGNRWYLAAVWKSALVKSDSKLDRDGINIDFKMAGSDEWPFPISEVVTNELAWKLIASEDEGIFCNIGSDCNIRGALVEIEMVALEIVVTIIVEIWDLQRINCLDDPVEVDVLGLLDDVDVHRSLEGCFSALECVNDLRASDGKSCDILHIFNFSMFAI